MEAWYIGGKLEATGYIDSTVTTSTEELTSHCKTINLSENEYVTKVKFESNE